MLGKDRLWGQWFSLRTCILCEIISWLVAVMPDIFAGASAGALVIAGPTGGCGTPAVLACPPVAAATSIPAPRRQRLAHRRGNYR